MTTLLQAPSNAEEQRIILPNISWQQYEILSQTLGDYPSLRLIYLTGTLEIFMPSAEHETLKKVIARLLERYAEEMDIPLHGYGSITFRQAARSKGLEPDECYCVGILKELPDLALEVNLTSGGVDKLEIYRGLDIPEVLIWQDRQLTLYDLRGSSNQAARFSQFFPQLDLSLLAQYIRPQEQPQAIKEFLNAIRG